ncbi:DUF1654 domain-containing protein [Phytopseudomonas flavescens]|uniref:DUF1654 domain-containing protein n=1 Tax=Phytopseudomonas flavescens TaxID=29435 RepID=UPI00111365B2
MARASRIGARSSSFSPNILLEQIACFGGGPSTYELLRSRFQRVINSPAAQKSRSAVPR